MYNRDIFISILETVNINKLISRYDFKTIKWKIRKILSRINKDEFENESRREWSSREWAASTSGGPWCYFLENYHKLWERSVLWRARISFDSTTRRGHIVGKLFIYEILDALKITGSRNFLLFLLLLLFCTVNSRTSLLSLPPTLEFALRIFAWLLDGKIVFHAWVQSHRRNEILSEFLKGKHFKKTGIVFLLSNCIKAVPDRSYARKRQLIDFVTSKWSEKKCFADRESKERIINAEKAQDAEQ